MKTDWPRRSSLTGTPCRIQRRCAVETRRTAVTDRRERRSWFCGAPLNAVRATRFLVFYSDAPSSRRRRVRYVRSTRSVVLYRARGPRRLNDRRVRHRKPREKCWRITYCYRRRRSGSNFINLCVCVMRTVVMVWSVVRFQDSFVRRANIGVDLHNLEGWATPRDTHNAPLIKYSNFEYYWSMKLRRMLLTITYY